MRVPVGYPGTEDMYGNHAILLCAVELRGTYLDNKSFLEDCSLQFSHYAVQIQKLTPRTVFLIIFYRMWGGVVVPIFLFNCQFIWELLH